MLTLRVQSGERLLHERQGHMPGYAVAQSRSFFGGDLVDNSRE
jgi:hypothetical protein